jgi:hypothetical protein
VPHSAPPHQPSPNPRCPLPVPPGRLATKKNEVLPKLLLLNLIEVDLDLVGALSYIYLTNPHIGHPSKPGKPVDLGICTISGLHAICMCGSASVGTSRLFEDLFDLMVSDLRTVNCNMMSILPD